MNFKPVRTITLSAVALLCPVALLAQTDGGYMSVSMAQASQSQPGQAGNPEPVPGQQPQAPSMQDSAGSTGQTPAMINDQMFLRKAAEDGLAEVQFGQLAAQRAASVDVKTLAQKMVDDHSAFNKQIEHIADSAGVKLPTHLSKKGQEEYDKLKGLSGEDFDTEYLTAMVKGHHRDLRQFRLEAANAQDQALIDVVVKGEKMIHQHMVMVDKLAKNKGIVVPHHYGNKPQSTPPQ